MKKILFLVLMILCGVLFIGCGEKTYKVSFLATAGGYISGENEQIVTEGSTSQVVKAVPNEDYEFVSWSDGVNTNPRFVKLDRDIMLRAIFSGTPHGFDNVPVNPNAQVHKIIVNDQVFIIRGDQTFTITGQVVK